MCVWCERYAEGYPRWYFNPANYARKLYKIRKGEGPELQPNPVVAGGMALINRDFIEALDRKDHEAVAKMRHDVEQLAWTVHFGQVVTLEDVLKVIDIIYPIALMTCACRRSMLGLANEENFTCMGMGSGMYKWERWPETYRGGVQFLTPDEARDAVTKMNKRGLVQTLFTFGTPYIGGICNCDYPDCSAIRTTIDHGIQFLWKGHYVARVDNELCNGCASCVHRCQFKALSFSASQNKAYIDLFQCFGCGLCATECPQEAITLVERASLPALANVW